MRRNQQNITYTIISQDAEKDIRKAIKTAIVEKLLLINREMQSTSN